jgi:hypothetical protein
VFSTNLKEFVMNDATELEVADLGEAKELTKGALYKPEVEDSTELPTRSIP